MRPNEHEEANKPVDPAKRRLWIIIAVIVGIALVTGAVFWYMYSQTYESTDDTQIDGHPQRDFGADQRHDQVRLCREQPVHGSRQTID